MMDFLLVGIGGFLGSISRYGISLLLKGGTGFPLSTFIVNILGSLIIGALVIYFQHGGFARGHSHIAIVGFCGGFTTFSSFSLESIKLLREGQLSLALLYVIASVIVCLGATYGGMVIASKIIK